MFIVTIRKEESGLVKIVAEWQGTCSKQSTICDKPPTTFVTNYLPLTEKNMVGLNNGFFNKDDNGITWSGTLCNDPRFSTDFLIMTKDEIDLVMNSNTKSGRSCMSNNVTVYVTLSTDFPHESDSLEFNGFLLKSTTVTKGYVIKKSVCIVDFNDDAMRLVKDKAC